MNVLKLIVGVLLAAALVVLGAQNTQSVTFQFLAWETPSVPVVLALAIGVLAGVLLSWIVSIPGRVHGMRERRALQHEVDRREPPPAGARSHEPSRGEEPPPGEEQRP